MPRNRSGLIRTAHIDYRIENVVIDETGIVELGLWEYRILEFTINQGAIREVRVVVVLHYRVSNRLEWQ